MNAFRCVITYRYEDRIVEIPSDPTSRTKALWLFDENGRLNGESVHILRAEVMSEQDYRRHVKTASQKAAIVAALLES